MNLFDFKKSLKSRETSSLAEKVKVRLNQIHSAGMLLVELLQKQKLDAGDVIPKEVDLAQLPGVSWTSIQEALTRPLH